MKELKIRVSNSIYILKPVPFAHLAALETCLTELQTLWLKYEAAIADLLLSEDGAIAIDLGQKIINLFPRVDEPGKVGFDITPLLDDLAQFEEIFFAVRDDSDKLDVFKGGLLLQLSRFNPLGLYQKAIKRLEEEAQPSPAVETSTPTF